MKQITKVELAEQYNVDESTISNWMAEKVPCPSEKVGRNRMFSLHEVARWREQRAVRQALERKSREKPDGQADLQLRRLQAETELAELDLRKALGSVISVEDHQSVAREHAGLVRAILINLPSNYALHLERLGVPAREAQEVLEAIASDLTGAIRETADALARVGGNES